MRADYCLEQAVEAIEAMEVEDNVEVSSAESKQRYRRPRKDLARIKDPTFHKGPDYS